MKGVENQFKCLLSLTVKLSIKIYVCGWKEHIYCQFQRIMNNLCYEVVEQRTRSFNGRISVNLNKPRFKIVINDKIKSKKLKDRGCIALANGTP